MSMVESVLIYAITLSVLATSSGDSLLYYILIIGLGIGNVVMAGIAWKQRNMQIELNKDRLQQNVDRMEQKIEAQEIRQEQHKVLVEIRDELVKANRALSHIR